MVRIEIDRNLDGTFATEIFDPKNILDADTVSVNADVGKCKDDSSNEECLIVSIYHTFRAPLEHNRFATYVWDHNRNGWQNYNHGIKALGDSMNPPAQHTAIHMGHKVTITETGPDRAVDESGNTWSFDREWRMDHVSKGKIDDGVMMHGINRNHVSFGEYRQEQVSLAQKALEDMMDGKLAENKDYPRHDGY